MLNQAPADTTVDLTIIMPPLAGWSQKVRSGKCVRPKLHPAIRCLRRQNILQQSADLLASMFLDTSIHDFDMARFMACGAEVTEVYATGSVMINKDQETTGGVDTTSVILKFDSGAMAIIDNCWQCAYGYDQRIELFGSTGSPRCK